MLTPREALDKLERELSRWPSASAWCRAHDISRHLLSDIRSGRLPISSGVAMAVGLMKVTAYEEVEWDGYSKNPADYVNAETQTRD